MALISRELVAQKLTAAFPDSEEADQALASLDRYGADNAAMVHLAIIKLCEGKLWKLRELVQAARDDFRDVLFPAQSPELFQLHAKQRPVHRGWSWGMLPPKRPSPKKAAAMAKKQKAMLSRDRKQWLDWLSGGP